MPKGPVLSRRTPTPPVSTPIPVEEAQPASHSASIAFDVVKSYVRIFPSWKYYTEDEGKCQLQVFVQELCVSNVIHGNYFALSHHPTSMMVIIQQIFPFFSIEKDRFGNSG